MNQNTQQKPLTIAYYALDYPSFPSPRLRVIEPCDYFNIQLLYGVTFSGNSVDISIDIIEQADLILVQRGFPRAETQKVLDFIVKSGKPIIYETDDLLTKIPDSHNKPIYNQIKNDIINFVKKAHYITVATDNLKQHYQKINPNTYTLPNLIDEQKWNIEPAKKTKNTITIGFYGSRGHIQDIKLIEPALLSLNKKYGHKIHFVFVGCITEKLKNLNNSTFLDFNFNYLEWPHRLANLQIDIGLVPLKETEFNQCISLIKWYEYAALEIPAVFSQVSPYKDTLINLETAILAKNNTASWLKALDKLIKDETLRQTIANNAKKQVYEHFTLAANGHIYRDFLTNIVKSKV